jgi:hypothetical protein
MRQVRQPPLATRALRLAPPPKLVILTVGQKDRILLGYPDHPAKPTELVQGPLKDVPLRDPLTMKPLSR